MSKAIEASEIEFIMTMMIYGINRSGKTWLTGSAHELEKYGLKTLVLDVDRGGMTLKTSWPHIKVIPCPLKERISKSMSDYVNEFKSDGYSIAIIDSISTMMYRFLYESAIGFKTPEYQHWTGLFINTLKFVQDLKAMAKVSIFTAFPAEIENKEGQVVGVTPLMEGKKFPRIMLNEFDVIAYLTTVPKTGSLTGVDRKFVAEPNNLAIAGDRLNNLFGTIMNPTMLKIYDRVTKAGLWTKEEVKIQE